MKKILAPILLAAATYCSISFNPSNISEESKDSAVFNKDIGESIENYLDTPGYMPEFDFSKYRFIEEKIFSDANINNINGNTYALLLNGIYNEFDEGNSRFGNNIKLMHDALSNIGIPEKHIIIVQDQLLGQYTNRTNPTKEGFEKALSYINNLMTKNDLLIFYMTNHGMTSIDDKEYNYLLENEVVNENYFLDNLKKSNAGAVWLINATCKAYIMTSKVSGKIIGNSFSGPHQNAVGGGTNALGKTLLSVANNKKEIDLNKDEMISIEEIARYTALNYEGTHKEGVIGMYDYKREVHYLTYQNVDPAQIIIK